MGKVVCPACGAQDLDVCAYDTMLVVRPDLALFTLECPACGASGSTLQRIPLQLLRVRQGSEHRCQKSCSLRPQLQLREEVRFAAIEVGAGMMGR